MRPPRPIAIVGPTAAGKTALSIEVASRVDGEIISVDSRQVYRYMDVGTAKASSQQRARIPHHGLDLVLPNQRFSAGEFGRRAREWIAEIGSRGHRPVLVGGTGFFLRALTDPIFAEPPLDPGRRDALRAWLGRLSREERERWLTVLDPGSASRLAGAGGAQRVLRALELPLLTGRTLPWWHREAPPEAEPTELHVFVLDLPRERLFRAIDARVGEMVNAGLLKEVGALLERGYDEEDPAMNATGYVELIPVVRDGAELAPALELIRKNTRAYARRQLTWFRHQLPADAVWLDGTRSHEDLADEIAARVGEPRDTQRAG